MTEQLSLSLGAIMNGTVNIHVQVSCGHMFSFLLDMSLGVECLGQCSLNMETLLNWFFQEKTRKCQNLVNVRKVSTACSSLYSCGSTKWTGSDQEATFNV